MAHLVAGTKSILHATLCTREGVSNPNRPIHTNPNHTQHAQHSLSSVALSHSTRLSPSQSDGAQRTNFESIKSDVNSELEKDPSGPYFLGADVMLVDCM